MNAITSKTQKIFTFAILVGIIILIGVYLTWFSPKEGTETNVVEVNNSSLTSIASTPNAKNSPIIGGIPDSYMIKDFPFQSQAPLYNWDELHDEACEEASVILVKFFIDKKEELTPEKMDEEILKMVQWEIGMWGRHKDLTLEETELMAREFYDLNMRLLSVINIEDIKKQISQGHPVILPTAGRLLGNPNFRQPGPVYHMLVVTGYTSDKFIVQDVGTKRGKNFEYNQDVLMNAIHDWAGSPENIENGQKLMLVLSD